MTSDKSPVVSDVASATNGIVHMQARARGMLARKQDVKALAEASTVTKAEAKAERQRELVSVSSSVHSKLSASSPSASSGPGIRSTPANSVLPSRAPRPLLPPPMSSPAFAAAAAAAGSCSQDDSEPLASARSLRQSIDGVMQASAAADALASSNDNGEDDANDPAKLASALFAGMDGVPQRPNASVAKGGQKRSPRFDIVSAVFFSCLLASLTYAVSGGRQISSFTIKPAPSSFTCLLFPTCFRASNSCRHTHSQTPLPFSCGFQATRSCPSNSKASVAHR